ncbi:MAG: TSUP family transporter [Clostridia bacterium]|nr:TSUP family transporter [Clostridia bacterium]MBQ8340403.1 TSUP family transporter [Clostridia bacterium]
MKRFFRRTLPVLAVGLGAGLLNGALGAGGGILIVLCLRPLLKGEENRRVYTTALSVTLPLSVLTLLRYWRGGALTGAAPLSLLLPALAGGALGSLLLRRLPQGVLSRIFAAVVLLSGVLMVV